MAHRVTLIPGDGIGPEVSEAVLRIVAAAGVEIEWESFIVGGRAQDSLGSSLPNDVIESIRRNGVALKGPVATAIGTGFQSVTVRLRKALDLYANLRPVRKLPGVEAPFGDVDLIIVRENTEDLYAGLEHEVVPGVVESLKIITEKASTRIAHFAFDHARAFGRKKVTAVHKANIMKKSDGLFLECFRRVAAGYPAIGHDEIIVDNACMQLVMDPHRFDVLVTENLVWRHYLRSRRRPRRGTRRRPQRQPGEKAALFEAVHGTAPDIAGKNVANPTALLMSAVMMLRHLGEHPAADRIEAGLNKVLASRESTTRDIGGKATTTEFREAVIAALST